MALYYSKDGLYREIAKLKMFLGMSKNVYGINLIHTLLNGGFKLQAIPFRTKGLRGMSIIGDDNADDVILLNSHRTFNEKNFDCGHEMIHLTLHRNIGQRTFNCFDRVQAHQNPFIEWQANEGAAEFFVPYKTFIPMIGTCYEMLDNYSNIKTFKKEMTKIFYVPDAVIKYRIENLKYEINQYISGIPIDDLDILSIAKQEERNIQVKSLNQASDDDFNRRMNAWNNACIS